jgi:thiosulfate/3-mercaptopyruvate sulfurtransferase
MGQYAHPEVLVETDWLASKLSDSSIRTVEVDVDTGAYDLGHIPGAVGWSWNTQLCDTVKRDILPKEQLEALLSKAGITPETAIVLYGDSNNWFAAWALWQLKIYGHKDVQLLNGGRKKWIAEGKPLTEEVPSYQATEYHAQEPDLSLRAFLPEVLEAVKNKSASLVDVRSPQEFTGEILAPPGLPETCQRGGHIPGARSVPWGKACNEDGTFKSFDELKALYGAEGVNDGRPTISYCRIGERSSHTWFVLKYLLGLPDVRNYDGSWTEWGNLVGVPVERGAAKAVGV